MLVCYADNGRSYWKVPNDYIAQVGEVLFPDVLTLEQLTTAFPNYPAYLAQVQAAKDAVAAIEAAKAQSYIDNLPSWQQVSDAIDAATTLATMKVIVKKMARVLYWLAKDTAT